MIDLPYSSLEGFHGRFLMLCDLPSLPAEACIRIAAEDTAASYMYHLICDGVNL